MNRHQPQPARPRLLRWLLIVLTVAGVGVWPGGHCVDDTSTRPTASIAAFPATDAAAPGATTARATSAPGHQDLYAPGQSGGPGTTVDECHIAPTSVTTVVNAAAPLPPGDERAPAVAPRPRPLTPCFSPGVALIRLGVSRT